MRLTILPLRGSLPRIFVRQTHYVRRGTLGEPFGEWDGTPTSVRKARERCSSFRLNYFLDESPKAWNGLVQYPVGRVEPRQVVVLKSLNRHLTPQDFERTVPRNLRRFIRVISLRSPLTLERHDNYMVVFDTPESADQWRKQLHWLADMSKRHTMTSTVVGRVVPQEGYKINGVHVAAVVRRFTLVPAEAALTSLCHDSLTPYKLKLAQRGGYRWAMKRDASPLPRVLLRVRGARLQPKDVLQALLHDSIRRNMAWDVDWRPERRLPAVVCLDDPLFRELAGEREPDERLRGDDQRWLVTFASERGAQLFARAWHARDFPFPPAAQARWHLSEGAKAAVDAGEDVKTYTEVLW